MNQYSIGDEVRVSVQFTDIDGTAVDPSVVTVKVIDPAGNVTVLIYDDDPDIVRDGAGSYYADVAVDAPGVWGYGWYGSGTYGATDERRFNVKRSIFPAGN